MADKEKKIVAVPENEDSKKSAATVKQATPTGNAGGLRVGAIILWILGIGFEVVAILGLKNKLGITFLSPLWQCIIALVLDLICVIIGSQLWKKSNRINPASEKDKVKFWLWNNLGVIISVIAFVPFIIIALTDKNSDKKTKIIATVVAVVALAIAGLTSYTWNPVSSEQLQAAQNALGDTTVYWTVHGNTVHKYHIDSDCYSLKNAVDDTIYSGTVDTAFEQKATALCKNCQKRHLEDIEGIENVFTGDEKGEKAEELEEASIPE